MAAFAAPLQTEFNFTLPRGYLAPDGRLHKKGRMRLATAMDEIAPLRDPRVRANQAYGLPKQTAWLNLAVGTG